jgi:hypothetical protein
MECVELASRRKAVAVGREMSWGVASLAVISATASFFGLLGTVLGMLGSFRSFGTSRSTAIGDIAGRLSQSLLPTLLGLLVAISAFCLYRYLSGQIETFELEMENASGQLISSLVIHLHRRGNAGGIYCSSLTKERKVASREILFLADPSMEGPRLHIERIYRNGVFELVWPRVQSQFHADCILQGGMWVSFAYSVIAWLTYFGQRRPIAGLIAAFFVLAALGLIENRII